MDCGFQSVSITYVGRSPINSFNAFYTFPSLLHVMYLLHYLMAYGLSCHVGLV